MRITRAQLLKVMPNAGSRADTYLPIINGWAEHFHINTPLRMAHYLAQIAHEAVSSDIQRNWQAAEPTRAGKTSETPSRAMA